MPLLQIAGDSHLTQVPRDDRPLLAALLVQPAGRQPLTALRFACICLQLPVFACICLYLPVFACIVLLQPAGRQPLTASRFANLPVIICWGLIKLKENNFLTPWMEIGPKTNWKFHRLPNKKRKRYVKKAKACFSCTWINVWQNQNLEFYQKKIEFTPKKLHFCQAKIHIAPMFR